MLPWQPVLVFYICEACLESEKERDAPPVLKFRRRSLLMTVHGKRLLNANLSVFRSISQNLTKKPRRKALYPEYASNGYRLRLRKGDDVN